MKSITQGIEDLCLFQYANDIQMHKLTGKIDATLLDILRKKPIACGVSVGDKISIKYVHEDETDLIIDMFFAPMAIQFKEASLEEIKSGLDLTESTKTEFAKCSSNSVFYAEQELNTVIKDIKNAINLEYLDTLYRKENPAFVQDCFNFFFEKGSTQKYNAVLLAISRRFRINVYNKTIITY